MADSDAQRVLGAAEETTVYNHLAVAALIQAQVGPAGCCIDRTAGCNRHNTGTPVSYTQIEVLIHRQLGSAIHTDQPGGGSAIGTKSQTGILSAREFERPGGNGQFVGIADAIT